MPLKIMLSGNRVTGKTTMTGKVAEKFGLNIIDPVELLKEAIEMAKPPVE